MKQLEYINKLRMHEAFSVLPFIPKNSRILEVGAGTGAQAKKFSQDGHHVEAIDISKSIYSQNKLCKVTVYDGHNIPFPDKSFDVIFSSNTLEHISHIYAFQEELKRVLKDGGLAIHILPTANWRLWTIITQYVYIIKFILIKLFTIKQREETADSDPIRSVSKKLFLIKAKRIFIPVRHGEFGSAFSELYYFSKYRWIRLFKFTGWSINTHFPLNLFYTGYMILGGILTIKARVRLSYIFGSSVRMFVLQKAK